MSLRTADKARDVVEAEGCERDRRGGSSFQYIF